MIIDEAMAAEEPQPGMPLALITDDALVRRALLVMQQSIDAPLSIGRVVAQMGVSRRKHLLTTTKRSATQIANETGFCDLPHMIKVFRVAEGTTPDAFRKTRV